MSQSKYFVILSHSFPSDICHSDRNNIDSKVGVGRNEAVMENEKESQVQVEEPMTKSQPLSWLLHWKTAREQGHPRESEAPGKSSSGRQRAMGEACPLLTHELLSSLL